MREVAGGELARDTEAEGKRSASEPKSPGVSGLLLDEKLCRRDWLLPDLAVDTGADGAFVLGGGTSVLGVSTTRKIRGWRRTDESETRETVVNGVLGRDPMAEAGPGPDTEVPDRTRSDLADVVS